MKRQFLIFTWLLVATQSPSLALAASRERPCEGLDDQRTVRTQGALLWGTQFKEGADETSSVLVSVDLDRVLLGGKAVRGVRIQGGRLEAPSLGAEGLFGAVFQGTDSDGKPVEVALCGGEPSAQDRAMVWYRIRIWNAESESWQSPCLATYKVPEPRALAMAGVWDKSGARHEVAGKFTFACELGVIAKCTEWGYRPWAEKEGRSLEELHQACTRMARADYCGDGRSHTRAGTPIDMYDDLGVLRPSTEDSPLWKRELGSFEAAWGPEGAWCLSRTRNGQPVEALLAQCPGRFEEAVEELGAGDHCTVRRKGQRVEGALLRNHSYGPLSEAPASK